jgi:hypothetical protein
MVTANTVRETVDRLAVEDGEKRGKVYRLTKTTGELIEMFGLKPSAPHHRHIKGIVEMHYPGTIAEVLGRGDGSDGFKLHIKIWSR